MGKTLAARWLASKLDRPLIVLDLCSCDEQFPREERATTCVMSLTTPKGFIVFFCLDEFDAIAKRRDDAIEIGES